MTYLLIKTREMLNIKLSFKKLEKKKKEPKFNLIKPKINWSIYGGWANAYQPVNKGRLGSTQEWRKEKPFPVYY